MFVIVESFSGGTSDRSLDFFMSHSLLTERCPLTLNESK